jgi:hypothetical protein
VTSPTCAPDQAKRLVASLRQGHSYTGNAADLLVGRDSEMELLKAELTHVGSGGSSLRFVAGTYGSGKSLLLNWVGQEARSQGFVVMKASLGPTARLSSTDGDAVRLLNQLTQNTSTKARPKGGAFSAVLERFLKHVSDSTTGRRLEQGVQESVLELSDLAMGSAVVHVLSHYVRAERNGDEQGRQNAIRWLRGEYRSRRESHRDLGTAETIADADVFVYLRVLALFVGVAGYTGLVLLLDELENLLRHLQHPQARGKNLEQVLELYNEAADDARRGTLIVIGATPETLDNERTGLASYGALKRRLITGAGGPGHPVIRLAALTPRDVEELASRILELWLLSEAPTAFVSGSELVVAAVELNSGIPLQSTPDKAIKAILKALDSSGLGGLASPSEELMDKFRL